MMSSHADLDQQISQLRECKFLSEAEVKGLCKQVKAILMEEWNCSAVPSSTARSMTSSTSSASAVTLPTPATSSWETVEGQEEGRTGNGGEVGSARATTTTKPSCPHRSGVLHRRSGDQAALQITRI